MTTTTIAATAGRTLGTAARYARQLNDQIDWAEVAAIVLHGLQVLVVLALLAGRATRRAWDALVPLSERMGKAYAAWLVGETVQTVQGSTPSTPCSTPVATAQTVQTVHAWVHPLQVLATELEALTRRELQALVGTRRKLGKAQLVAMALAC